MKSDEEIQKEIKNILKHDPALDATNVSPEVKDGIVKLVGSVHEPAAKWMVKEAIKHVSEIKDIIDELEVNPPPALYKNEP